MRARLSHECAWCVGFFDPAVSHDSEFCCPDCREEAGEAVQGSWGESGQLQESGEVAA